MFKELKNDLVGIDTIGINQPKLRDQVGKRGGGRYPVNKCGGSVVVGINGRQFTAPPPASGGATVLQD